MTTDEGTQGVGRASTRSVVISSILLILVNVLLVRLIFFIYPEAA
jgi:phospholipid/cholesterol/gamma-HCH transport system permease protein